MNHEVILRLSQKSGSPQSVKIVRSLLTDMRTTLLLASILLLCVLVCSSPIDPKRILINRPREHDVFKRSAQVKGGKPGVKGYDPPTPSLRKGEFMCGNRVCKLKPGQIPPGCNGVCQYRVN